MRSDLPSDLTEFKNIQVTIQLVKMTELNTGLRQFYESIRTTKGELYSITHYYLPWTSGWIKSYQQTSGSWNLMRDPEIIPANNVFRGVVKEIRGAGNDKPTQYPRISPEDQCIFKHSAAVRPDNPNAFVSKVWSDIQLHFGHGGKEGYQDLKPESLILKCDNVGEKYFTMNRNNKS